MIDPNEPLTLTEAQVFGADAKRHPVLGFFIEQSSGCLSVDQQAANHIREIEWNGGKAAADALRSKLADVEQPPTLVK